MHALWRLFAFLRPYFGQLAVAMALLGISGALMGAIVATVKPLVNDVLLPGQVTAQQGAQASGADILRQVREWLPLDLIAGWARERAFGAPQAGRPPSPRRY